MTACQQTRPVSHAGTATHTRVDCGLALLHTGYPYLLGLRRRWRTATAEIRLLGRRTTVLSGPDGVQLFYNEALVRRRGAIPAPLRNTLFGKGAIHGLDDEEHKHRKAMFVELLTPEAARAIATEAAGLWAADVQRALDPVGVFESAVEVHCAAACRWAGVPDAMVDRRLGDDLALIVDGFGSVGRRGLRARLARRRVDRWAQRVISRVRGGYEHADPDSALAVIATASRLDGRQLPARVAAVELINVLRPTVAVAYFVAFAAHAVRTQPGLRDRLAGADDATYEAFAHELRRHYPFVPMLAARVRRPITFHGRPLTPGRRVLLDVYGTLHDPELWDEPQRFDLDRFRGTEPGECFVPQGGGDVRTGHRCPGERIAVELIKTATRHLVDQPVGADVPCHIPLDRLPTRPLRTHAAAT